MSAHQHEKRRELLLAEQFGLTLSHRRIGYDATDRAGNEYELKTTCKGSVSTARDLGPRHLGRWRNQYWIIAKGREGSITFEPAAIFFLAPEHMAGWYAEMERRFSYDAMLSIRVEQIARDHLDQFEADRLTRILDRGRLMNDPNIPWAYIESNGIDITTAGPSDIETLTRVFRNDL